MQSAAAQPLQVQFQYIRGYSQQLGISRKPLEKEIEKNINAPLLQYQEDTQILKKQHTWAFWFPLVFFSIFWISFIIIFSLLAAYESEKSDAKIACKQISNHYYRGNNYFRINCDNAEPTNHSEYKAFMSIFGIIAIICLIGFPMCIAKGRQIGEEFRAKVKEICTRGCTELSEKYGSTLGLNFQTQEDLQQRLQQSSSTTTTNAAGTTRSSNRLRGFRVSTVYFLYVTVTKFAQARNGIAI